MVGSCGGVGGAYVGSRLVGGDGVPGGVEVEVDVDGGV